MTHWIKVISTLIGDRKPISNYLGKVLELDSPHLHQLRALTKQILSNLVLTNVGGKMWKTSNMCIFWQVQMRPHKYLQKKCNKKASSVVGAHRHRRRRRRRQQWLTSIGRMMPPLSQLLTHKYSKYKCWQIQTQQIQNTNTDKHKYSKNIYWQTHIQQIQILTNTNTANTNVDQYKFN